MENEIGLSRGLVLSSVGPLWWIEVFCGDKKIKWNVSVRPAVPESGWGDQKASSEEMVISDQQLKIEFSSNSFFLWNSEFNFISLE